jgi:hypothetical protein
MLFSKGDWRSAWGYSFQYTPDHLTSDELRPLMYTYDTLGQDALEALDRISPPTLKPATPSPSTTGNHMVQRDLFVLLKENASSDEALGKLWTQVTTIPGWVDWGQIERGQQVFYRYGGPAIVSVSPAS